MELLSNHKRRTKYALQTFYRKLLGLQGLNITNIEENEKSILTYFVSDMWRTYSTTITNGFTEGCNNKIKVLKRNAYGYQNFKTVFSILHKFINLSPILSVYMKTISHYL